jgi:hypothetical protein
VVATVKNVESAIAQNGEILERSESLTANGRVESEAPNCHVVHILIRGLRTRHLDFGNGGFGDRGLSVDGGGRKARRSDIVMLEVVGLVIGALSVDGERGKCWSVG